VLGQPLPGPPGKAEDLRDVSARYHSGSRRQAPLPQAKALIRKNDLLHVPGPRVVRVLLDSRHLEK
jgi:hypothetical protein